MTPSSNGNNMSFFLSYVGSCYAYMNVNRPYSITPVLYLKSSVQITGGDGSYQNAYQIQ